MYATQQKKMSRSFKILIVFYTSQTDIQFPQIPSVTLNGCSVIYRIDDTQTFIHMNSIHTNT